jgi:hypothetical protein
MGVEQENRSVGARGKFGLLAQEIAFAKILAGNNKTLRERGVKRLARWLNARSRGKCGKYVCKLTSMCGLCVRYASGMASDVFR